MISTEFLPVEMQQFLPADLQDNKANFPEFEARVSAARVDEARDRLWKLDLLHRTQMVSGRTIQRRGLKPLSELPDSACSATGKLDRSLGLDKAVFFGWSDHDFANRGLWCLVGAQLLLDEHVVVTPSDIVWFASPSTPYDELPADGQAKVEKYFSKMLPGTDWLELMAIRLARKRSASLVSTGGLAFGEVKVFRPVEPSELRLVESDDSNAKTAIIQQAFSDGFVTHWSYLMDEGFISDDTKIVDLRRTK